MNVRILKTAAAVGLALTLIAPSLVSAAINGMYTEGEILDITEEGKRGVITIGDKAGVNVADQFYVVRAGEKIVDPNTRKMIRIKQEIIGQVEVIATGATYADVKFNRGGKDIRKGDYVRRHTSEPTGLSSRNIGFRAVELSWELQDEPETEGYRIYRASSAQSGYELIGKTTRRNNVVYVDKYSRNNEIKDNTRYYYHITAVNGFDIESKSSDPIKAVTLGAPDPPTGLSAAGAIRQVSMSWESHSNEEVAAYRIYRASSTRGPWNMIKEIKNRKEVIYYDYGPDGSTSKPTLDESTEYYYAISAVSPFGDEGPRSKYVKATTEGKPKPPSGLVATGWQPRKVPLVWDMSPNEDVKGYVVNRAVSERGPYEEIGVVKGREKTEFVDDGSAGTFIDGLPNGAILFYAIQTYNWADSRSPMSNTASTMTKPGPLPIEDFIGEDRRARQAPLNWRKSPEADLAKYHLYRADDKDGEFKKLTSLTPDTENYLDDRLEDDKSYYYKIKVEDKYGLVSEFSRVATVTTKKLPATVTGGDWKRHGADVILSWNKNPEKDIKVYRIYKKGFFGWSKVTETTESTYTITGVSSGDNDNYAITAIDVDGLEGLKSDPIPVDLR